MLQVLTDDGFAAEPSLGYVFEEYEAETEDAWDRPISGGGTLEDQPALHAWNTLRAQLPALVGTCRGHSAPEERLVVAHWQQVIWGAEQLAHGLPCGERVAESGQVTAVTVEVILNACWLAKLTGMETLAEEVGAELTQLEGFNRVNRVLDGLTMKSIEIAQFRSHV